MFTLNSCVCLGLLALLFVVPMISATVGPGNNRCIQQCSQNDFLAAKAVGVALGYGINRSTADPNFAVNSITNLFSPTESIWYGSGYAGVGPSVSSQWSSFGPSQVKAGLQFYWTSGYTGENSQTTYPYLFVWDCTTRTLVIEWGWKATLDVGVPRDLVFTVDSNGNSVPTITLPGGTTYTDVHAEYLTYDQDFNLIQYREYYNPAAFKNTYTTNYNLNSGSVGPGCAIPKCSNADRAQAEQISGQLVYAINLIPINATLAAELFSGLFNAQGVYSTDINPSVFPYTPSQVPQANFFGPAQIATQFLFQANSETEQSTTILTSTFDCTARTLVITRVYEATLTSPRAFGAIPKPAGFKYSVDILDVIRFNSAYEISYFRSYYDGYQFASYQPTPIAPAAAYRCNNPTGCEQIIPH